MSARRESGAASVRIEDTIRQLEALWASERAAVGMYRGASRDVTDPVLGRRLAAIAERHAGQAAELHQQIARLSVGEGATLPEELRTKLSEMAASPSGDAFGWRTLRERERMGLKSYREALDRIDPSAREVFLGSLIPAQFRNVCAWSERSTES